MSPLLPNITIRNAHPGDMRALIWLAALDGARPLTGDVLVAELDGRILAAMASDGRAIAHPFEHTADLVAELRARAAVNGAATAPAGVRVGTAAQPAC